MSHGRLNPTSAQVDWTWMPQDVFAMDHSLSHVQDAIGRVNGLTTKNFQQKGYGDLIACNCCSRQVEATRKQQHETLDSFFAGWEGKGWRRFFEFLKVTRCFRETPACFQAIQPHIISHDMSWVCMFVCFEHVFFELFFTLSDIVHWVRYWHMHSCLLRMLWMLTHRREPRYQVSRRLSTWIRKRPRGDAWQSTKGPCKTWKICIYRTCA